MKITVKPGTSNEQTLRRIAIAFAKQLFSGRRLGALERPPKTILLPLQSHNLEIGDDGDAQPKIKGEEKNDKDKNKTGPR